MIEYTSGSSIPTQFANITKLNSIERQRALGRMINDIDELLRLSKDITLSQQINHQLDQYFQYLSRTCSSLTHLNRWSSWLLKYGCIVRDRLNQEYCQKCWVSSPPTNLEHNEMIEKITLFVETIGRLQTTNHFENQSDQTVIVESLDYLIKHASANINHNGSVYYRKMCEDLDRMIWFYTALTSENVILMTTNLTSNILNDISKLNSNTKHSSRPRYEERMPMVSVAG